MMTTTRVCRSTFGDAKLRIDTQVENSKNTIRNGARKVRTTFGMALGKKLYC